MSSAVAELDGYLQSMLALKPPGVSGSKISSITSLCSANVQVRNLFMSLNIWLFAKRMQFIKLIAFEIKTDLISFFLSPNPSSYKKSIPISREHQGHTSSVYSMS